MVTLEKIQQATLKYRDSLVETKSSNSSNDDNYQSYQGLLRQEKEEDREVERLMCDSSLMDVKEEPADKCPAAPMEFKSDVSDALFFSLFFKFFWFK